MERATAALNKSGFCCTLIGPAGIGKSALVRQYAWMQRKSFVHTVSVRIDDQPAGSTQSLANATESLLERFPRADAAIASRLQPILQGNAGAPESISVQLAYAKLLRHAAADGPLLFIAEDLHWADARTVGFLANLARELSASPIAFIFTMRLQAGSESRDLARMLARLAKIDSAHMLFLPPLSRAQVRTLVQESLPPGARIGIEDSRRIAALSEGSPFYAAELLRWYLRRGSNGAEVPASLQLLIRARLGSLLPGQRRIIRVAAAIGSVFSLEDLQAATDAPLSDVLETLLVCSSERLISEEEPGRFRFDHAITRNVIYSELLSFERKAIHARIFFALERRELRSFHVLELLSRHSFEAGEHAASLGFSEAFGDEAYKRAMPGLAVTAYERALAGALEPRRSLLMQKMANAARESGLLERSMELFLQLIEQAPAQQQAQLWLDYGLTARYALRNLTAKDAFETALALGLEHGDPGAASRAARMLAGMEIERPDPVAAARLLEPYRVGDTPEDTSKAAAMHAAIAAASGDVAAARRYTELSTLHARGEASGLLPAYALGAGAFVYTFLGLAGESIALYDEVIRLHADSDALGADFLPRLRMAYALFLAGDLERAHETLARTFAPPDIAIGRIAEMTAALPIAALLGDDGLARRVYDEGVVEAAITSGELTRAGPLMLGLSMFAEYRQETSGLAALFDRVLRLADCGYGSEPALAFCALYGTQEAMHRAEAMLTSSHTAVGGACRLLFQSFAAGGEHDKKRYALAAAEQFASIGWPYFHARSLEAAGDRDSAAAMYGAMGAVAAQRRLFGKLREPGDLSRRESEIASLVAGGLTSPEIGRLLSLSVRTVDNHLASAYRKLGVRTRAELAVRMMTEQREALARD